MGPDKRLLVGVWNITKRSVLTLTLRILHRWLGAQRLRFVDDQVDAGYATYRTLAILDVSIGSLFPVHRGLGPVPIAHTPHF